MSCCTLRGTLLAFLVLALVALLERTVFDFLGYMWSPIVADIVCWMFLVVCIFGAAQRRSACLLAYLPWALVWMAWNALIICIYLGFGALQVTPVLNMNTGSVSWWVHGIGCQYNLTLSGQVDPTSVTGCALPYQYVEVLQAAVQILLGLITLSLAAAFVRVVIREENEVKVVRDAEMQYIHMREEQSGAATPQSARHTSRPAARTNGDGNYHSNTQTMTTTGTLSSSRLPGAPNNAAYPYPYAAPLAANVNPPVQTPSAQTSYPAAPAYPNAATSYGDPRTAPIGQQRSLGPATAQPPPVTIDTGRPPRLSEAANPNSAAYPSAARPPAQQPPPPPKSDANNEPMRRGNHRQSASSARSKQKHKLQSVPPNPAPITTSRPNFGTTETVLQPSDDASSDDNQHEPARAYATSSFKSRQNTSNKTNQNHSDDSFAQGRAAPSALNQQPVPAYSQPVPRNAPGRNLAHSQQAPSMSSMQQPANNLLTHSHPRQQNVPKHPIPSIFAGQSPSAANWQPTGPAPATAPAPAPVAAFSQPTPTGPRPSSRSNLNRHTPPHVTAPSTQNRAALASESLSSATQSPAGAVPRFDAFPGQSGLDVDDVLPPYQPRAPAALPSRPVGYGPPSAPPQSGPGPGPASLANNQPNRASFGSQRMLSVNTQMRNNSNSLAQKSPAPSTGSVMLIGAPSVV